MNIAKFLRTPILKNICERLILPLSLHISIIVIAFHLTINLSVFSYNATEDTTQETFDNRTVKKIRKFFSRAIPVNIVFLWILRNF